MMKSKANFPKDQTKWSSLFLVGAALVALVLSGCQSSEETTKAKAEPPALPTQIPFEKKIPDLPSTAKINEAPIQNLELDGIPAELKQQCAVAICGNPASVVAPWPWNWVPAQMSTEEKSWFEKDILNRLNLIQDLQLENAKQAVQTFDDAKIRLGTLQLDASHLAYANVIWFSSHIREAYQSLKPSEDGRTWIVDDALLAKSLPSMTAEDRQFMKTFLADLLASWEWGVLNYVRQIGVMDFLSLVMPDQSLETAEQQFGISLYQSIAVLRAQFPELDIDIPRSVVALSEGRDLTPELLNELEFSILLAYEGRMVQEQKLFASRPMRNIDQLVSRYADQVLTPIKEQLADPEKLEEQKVQIQDSCAFTLVGSWQQSPTRVETKTAKAWLEQVKNQALTEGLKLAMNSEQEQVLTKAIQAARFSLPLSKEDLIEPMKLALNDELKAQLALQQQGVQSSDMNLFLKIYADTVRSSNQIYSTPEACYLFIPGTLTDHAMTALGKVSLSWPTIKFPEFGIAVAAHEVGHLISGQLREMAGNKQRLMDRHACIAARHGNIPEPAKWQFSEEDFADQIAADVAKELRKGGTNVQNKGCLLMGHDDKVWGRRGLSVKWPAGFQDGHSTDFFRTLEMQINSGQELPESCQTIVNQYAPEVQHLCN